MAWCVDNFKLFSPVKMRTVSEAAQEELTRISDYALKWQIKFSGH